MFRNPNETMKICTPTYWYPEYPGDIHATYVHDITRYLVKGGNEVHVVTPDIRNKGGEEIYEGVKVFRFKFRVPTELSYGKVAQGSSKKGIFRSLRKLFLMFLYMSKSFIYTYKTCKKYDCDVIHAHWAIPSGFPSVLVSKILKKPCFITMHGGDVYYNPKEGYVYPKLWYIKPFLKYTLKNATKLTAITEDCAQHAVNAGARERDIVVIKNGADLERFSPGEIDEDIVKKYGLKGNTIFTCRQLIPRKGIRFLIGAMPKILENFPDAKLIIAGDGVERQTLERLIIDLRLEGKVFLIGWIKNDELPKYYNSSTVVVMPSLEEGFGIPAAEAMGCEKPVVSTDAGGLIEVIEDNVTGYIVNKGSSEEIARGVVNVLSDKEKAKEMGKAGRERALKLFSWAKTVEEFSKLYLEHKNVEGRDRTNKKK